MLTLAANYFGVFLQEVCDCIYVMGGPPVLSQLLLCATPLVGKLISFFFVPLLRKNI